ncbi:MAG TPA: biotin carboxylase N-terminal domain-containing protein [Mycobacteriales bacterium]|nr:biotin carboxylase N-terminal domain-containing protein [Mycobacteriales bacterium]
MFDTVLVAGRGEIAVRIMRTLHSLGIRAIAVYSDADRGARHVQDADRAVHIGPAPATQSYLDIGRIIEAARLTSAQAIHPGYGFLSENPNFAKACANAGLVFIGPPAGAIDAMGDKIRAKHTVSTAGVPVVPGFGAADMDDNQIAQSAAELGLPVLLKPSAGGGGKGMRLVRTQDELPEAIAGARREARGAFGDDTLLVERFLSQPRHIEVQVVADGHGTVIHLGERECSLQRRHQKIIEEAPSPLLNTEQRARMGSAAVAAARAVGYVGAGTVEFILSNNNPDEFFFMEMNTRLQVEHPVTELVTGLDLVEMQVRIAAGELLPFRQVRLRGHAVEARVYAEDPVRDFLPSAGPVLRLTEPSGTQVRVDSGILEGSVVSSDYDPMLAKVITWGADRNSALRRMDRALAGTTVLGLHTNVAFLRRLLADPDVAAGRLDTGLVERRAETLRAERLPAAIFAAAAVLRLAALDTDSADPFAATSGWRVGEPGWASWVMYVDGHDPVEVRARGRADAAEVAIGEGAPTPAALTWHGADALVEYAGASHHFSLAVDGPVTWLGRDGASWPIREVERLAASRRTEEAVAGPVRAPMPGTVAVVQVTVGDRVIAGQPLLVVEAMKMEHVLAAPVDGVVATMSVQPGQPVAMGQVLAIVAPATG